MPSVIQLVLRALAGLRPFADPANAWWFWLTVYEAFPDTRHIGQTRIFEEISPPEPVRDLEHQARVVRYVHLNPCRARLVTDPLS